jgi:uncharacterized membrane protein
MKSISYLRIVTFVFLTLCVFGAAIAFIGDSAHLFHSGYEKKIAESLNSNYFVEGVTNYDERLVQKFRLNSLPIGTELNTIILGSSRTMQISENLFRKRTINLSVSGAGIEDYIALYHLAKKFNPKRVVIGVDPWVFNAKNGLVGWKTLSDEFLAESANLGSFRGPSIGFKQELWSQLFNITYIRASLRSNLGARLRRMFNASFREDLIVTAVENPSLDRDGIRPDGSRIYNLHFAERSPNEVESSAIQFGTPPFELMSGFQKIDPACWSLFKKFILDVRSRSKVLIALAPFHPSSYKMILPLVPTVHEVEQRIREFTGDNGILIVGSYDPERVNCDKVDFLDGLHPKTGCISRMFATRKLELVD